MPCYEKLNDYEQHYADYLAQRAREDRIERRLAWGLFLAGLFLLVLISHHFYVMGGIDMDKTLRELTSIPSSPIDPVTPPIY